MRGSILVVATLAACGASSSSMRRSLVTDDVHAGEARADVIAWHDAHAWCRGPAHPDTDAFLACHVAMLEPHTPPVTTWVEYRDERVVATAVFVPVPCRVTGFCDHADTADTFDHLYAPGGTRIGQLASAGLHRDPPAEVPSIQRRLLDALAVELDARYGPAAWHDDARTSLGWTAPRGEHIALFLADGGDWVVETHLFGPP